MHPRLSPARVQSFVSAYCCSHTAPGASTSRLYSTCQSHRQHIRIHPRRVGLQSSNHLGQQVCHIQYCYVFTKIEVMQRAFHASSANSAQDPYKVLGVNKDASPAEIKKVYFSVSGIALRPLRCKCSIYSFSSRESTILTRTQTKMHRRSSLRYRRHMMYVIPNLTPSYLTQHGIVRL